MASSVLSFLGRNRRVIVVWSGDEDCVMEVFGERIHVPPTDEVADFGQPGSKFRFPAAKDQSGKDIPGTVVLTDKWARNRDTQEDYKQFDAEAFAKQLEARNGALLARGLTMIEDVKDVEAVREEGRPKWLKAKAKQWDETIRLELARQEFWTKQGQPAPESSSAKSLKEAIAGLKTVRQKLSESTPSKDELLSALGAGPAVPFTSAPEPEEEVFDADKAALDLHQAAEAAGVNLTKPELNALLKRDVDAMEAIAEKIAAAKAAV